MTTKRNFFGQFFFSKFISENSQQDRVVFFLLACDYLGQNSQKHVFWSFPPIPQYKNPTKWLNFINRVIPYRSYRLRTSPSGLKCSLGYPRSYSPTQKVYPPPQQKKIVHVLNLYDGLYYRIL